MDRDKRWDRVAKAYAAIVDAKGPRFADAKSAIEDSYAKGINDEFVVPCVIGGDAGGQDSDALLFAHFLPHRPRVAFAALLDAGVECVSRLPAPRVSFRSSHDD